MDNLQICVNCGAQAHYPHKHDCAGPKYSGEPDPPRCQPGHEIYKKYWSKISQNHLIQYDYRHVDGELFSCVRITLEVCREHRNSWLKRKFKKFQEKKNNSWEAIVNESEINKRVMLALKAKVENE